MTFRFRTHGCQTKCKQAKIILRNFLRYFIANFGVEHPLRQPETTVQFSALYSNCSALPRSFMKLHSEKWPSTKERHPCRVK